MDISARWYGAAGATLVAAGVSARYVAKWRRRRYLRQNNGRRRGPSGRYYIGLDLTDPSADRKRACDVAVLDPDLHCSFDKWQYREDGSGIVPKRALGKSFILAIDGPQGLAGDHGATVRESERLVRAPGRTPYEFPENGKPYSGFINGSVRLFYRLVTSGSRFRLLGLEDVPLEDANLLEVYPGGAWRILAEQQLSQKRTLKGRWERKELLESVGVGFNETDLPTDDQLDAALAAWVAYCFDEGRAKPEGKPPDIDEEAKVIREGYVVVPYAPAVSIDEPDVAPSA